MKKINHPLMHNNITKNDLSVMVSFLKKNPKLTQGEKVLLFEKKWSKWLGVKYSVFVNSGSSANLLTLCVLKEICKTGEVIVPPLTWISDIVSVVKSGFKPVFVDIDLKNLSMNEDQIIKSINKKTRAVFITHVQGFNGLSERLLKILKKRNIHLIEDVCESHGATFKRKKLGTYGLISNFSFYYAHHLSTIEGGMVCTNSKKIYRIARMLRAHGMLRECGDLKYENSIIKQNPHLSPKFIFMYPGYNFRNNELNAVLGINQLKRLDKNNLKRNENLNIFLKNLNDNYFKKYDLIGCSNYAFPLILKKRSIKNRNKLEKILIKYKIEFRRGNAGGGNQLRQPYIKKYIKKFNKNKFKNVEHVHSYGYYIGNYPDLNKKKIVTICKILNNIKYI